MPITSHQIGGYIGGQQAALLERFQEKILLDKNTGCWLWVGSRLKKSGYGKFWHRGRKVFAHRISYELHKGPLPPGMQALHDCDNTSCVNPDHLHAGTQKDNQQEMVKRGRAAFGDRNGSRAHPECLVRGECHHKAKLTAAQVRQIRKKRSLGQKLQVIADQYHVSDVLIRLICQRKIWKHVE